MSVKDIKNISASIHKKEGIINSKTARLLK